MWSIASSIESTTFTPTMKLRYSVSQSSVVAGLALRVERARRSSPRISTLLGGQVLADLGSSRCGDVLVEEQVLDRVADRAAGVAGLGVHADVADLLVHAVDGGVDVDVAVAGEVLEDRDRRILDDRADEALAAAGDDQVDVLVELEQERDEGAVGRFDELHGGGIDRGFLQCGAR